MEEHGNKKSFFDIVKNFFSDPLEGEEQSSKQKKQEKQEKQENDSETYTPKVETIASESNHTRERHRPPHIKHVQGGRNMDNNTTSKYIEPESAKQCIELLSDAIPLNYIVTINCTNIVKERDRLIEPLQKEKTAFQEKKKGLSLTENPNNTAAQNSNNWQIKYYDAEIKRVDAEINKHTSNFINELKTIFTYVHGYQLGHPYKMEKCNEKEFIYQVLPENVTFLSDNKTNNFAKASGYYE